MPTTYPGEQFCTAADIQMLLKYIGAQSHADDYHYSSEHEDADAVYAYCINYASRHISQYTVERYNGQDLLNVQDYEGARWVNIAATTIAAWRLLTRGGNPAPQNLIAEIEVINQTLEAIKANQSPLPGVPELSKPVPTVTRFTVRPGRARPIRVKIHQSTGGPSSLPRVVDYRSMLYSTLWDY